jgi:Tol biopolymer transport system component
MSESHCSHSLSDCRSLISACANSGGQYGKENPRQVTVPGDVKVLSAQAVKELSFSDSELAVVFAMDKNGNIQTYTTDEEKTTEKDFPLPAGEIEHMNTITTFQTSNPKTCWLMHGTLSCISW